MLILLHHVKVGTRSKRRQTALHVAAAAGHAVSPHTINCQRSGCGGGHVMTAACFSCTQDLVNLLVSHGADVTALDCDGYLPLTAAATHGATEALEALLTCNSSAFMELVVESEKACRHPLVEVRRPAGLGGGQAGRLAG